MKRIIVRYPLNDTRLIEQLQNGSIEAFDTIYRKYSVKLYSFGYRYLKSASEAEELVQSVFVKIWEQRSRLDKNLSLQSFLFTLTYNDICKIFRRRTYMNKFIQDSLNEKSEACSEAEENLEYQSVLENVRKIINKLPDRQRTIFLKSREEGKSSKEIASEVGLSSGTVDNYISGSLKIIRSLMKKEDLEIILLLSMFYL